MPTLYPPDYPWRADAPLLSFGPAFAEEIARSVLQALWRPPEAPAHEDTIRVSAALTMLEAFHPRDHLECMLAAQGVATHAMIMDCHRRAMHPGVAETVAIKIRGNIAQLNRTFSGLTHDLERRQAKPLPPRPPGAAAPVPPLPPLGGPPLDGPPPGARMNGASANGASLKGASLNGASLNGASSNVPSRPDGTPASLTAYAPPVPPDPPYIPPEPEIMMALATRPKPWRMVNAPAGTPEPAPDPAPARAVIAPPERMFTGDALARFTSARFDPNAPMPPLFPDDEGAMVELELISTGGDPELEAERAALAAAHPEGRPAVTIRYGRAKPAPTRPPDES